MPVGVGYSALSRRSYRLPGAIHLPILVLQTYGSRGCPLGIIPMIVMDLGHQMRNVDVESGGNRRPVIDHHNIGGICYTYWFLQTFCRGRIFVRLFFSIRSPSLDIRGCLAQ